jgi:glycosyltransferase involved in cell wall biosynthesis
MRIWQLDPANLTPYYDRALCAALAAEGHEVRWISSKFLYDPLDDLPGFITDRHYFRALEHPLWLKVPPLRKAARALAYPWGHGRLAQKLAVARPDMLHLQWSRLPRFDLWLIHRARALGIPVVHTIHDVTPLFDPAGDLGAVYAAADALILHSQDSIAQFQNRYPQIGPEKLRLIPHLALDPPPIPAGASRQRARHELGLPEEGVVFLFFGAVKAYKGLDILYQAYQQVLEDCPRAYLIVAGHPENEAQKQIMAQVAALPRTLVQPGFIPEKTLWSYFLAADVALYPYREITQSGAVITAMQMAKPLILTQVGGLPDLSGDYAWLIPPEDPPALAAAMQKAYEQAGQLASMGERARAWAGENLSPARIAQAHLALYTELATSDQRLAVSREQKAGEKNLWP